MTDAMNVQEARLLSNRQRRQPGFQQLTQERQLNATSSRARLIRIVHKRLCLGKHVQRFDAI